MKILIADNHLLLADALAQLVKDNEADSEVLQAGSLDDAMEKMDRDGTVEIVLVDYDLPGLGGVEGLERLRSRHPKVPCAIFSGSEDVRLASSALASGAAGFIPKSMSAPAFFHAIKLMQVGEKFFPAGLYEYFATQASVNQVNEESAENFRRQFLGRTMTALWEKQSGDGIWSGLTDNYIKVYTRSDEDLTNKLLPVKLVEVRGDRVWGWTAPRK